MNNQLMLVISFVFSIFSVIWFVGHATVRFFDWEFWFSLSYTLFSFMNLYYFHRLKHKN
ncbi:MAG: hypothetical protein K9J12_04660 [Melioribacteraceae bacterium]|nr:hypothetical protein [Melioribacteraceae bacterium]MCF8265041.1 hypothetical protein [Melioribacteraceae bacterium]